jgi:hypothetical protein
MELSANEEPLPLLLVLGGGEVGDEHDASCVGSQSRGKKERIAADQVLARASTVVFTAAMASLA